MTRLKFEDIDEWTPSSISIVDVPAHPLCKFEVYEDDEEFVKKSIEIDEGEIMEESKPQIEEPMVHAPVSFFEKLLGRTVGKAVEEEKPQEEKKEADDSAILARIEKLEARVAELEKAPEPKEEEQKEDVVAKSEGEASEGETPEQLEEEVVVKSKSLDPDTIITPTESDKSLVERAGRKTNGMTW